MDQICASRIKVKSNIEINVRGYLFPVTPLFTLIYTERDILISPADRPALSGAQPGQGVAPAAAETPPLLPERPLWARCWGDAPWAATQGRFCTSSVKMLHIPVQTNDNKRAACSNSTGCRRLCVCEQVY